MPPSPSRTAASAWPTSRPRSARRWCGAIPTCSGTWPSRALSTWHGTGTPSRMPRRRGGYGLDLRRGARRTARPRLRPRADGQGGQGRVRLGRRRRDPRQGRRGARRGARPGATARRSAARSATCCSPSSTWPAIAASTRSRRCARRRRSPRSGAGLRGAGRREGHRHPDRRSGRARRALGRGQAVRREPIRDR